jgi:hypothetical protein
LVAHGFDSRSAVLAFLLPLTKLRGNKSATLDLCAATGVLLPVSNNHYSGAAIREPPPVSRVGD